MDHAVIIFAHGSRDPLWHRPMQAVADRLREKSPTTLVRCAYLELTEPDLATATAELLAAGTRHIRILPMFLGVGRHAREDLPQLVNQLRAANAEIAFTLMPSVGEDPRVLALLAELALEAGASDLARHND